MTAGLTQGIFNYSSIGCAGTMSWKRLFGARRGEMEPKISEKLRGGEE
jgi:hypothetical protein